MSNKDSCLDIRSNRKGIAISLILFLLFRILMEASIMANFSSSIIFIFMGLYIISSILFALFVLVNKRTKVIYKLLAVLGVFLLMYSSFSFHDPL